MRQQRPRADGFYGDTTFFLQRQLHALACVQRAARAGERQARDSIGEPLDGRGAGQHTVAGVQPGGRLLENLTQGMDVATARLPVFRLREKLTDGAIWWICWRSMRTCSAGSAKRPARRWDRAGFRSPTKTTRACWTSSGARRYTRSSTPAETARWIRRCALRGTRAALATTCRGSGFPKPSKT